MNNQTPLRGEIQVPDHTDVFIRNPWQQWDFQCRRNRERAAYVELNNLYLGIERGEIALTITTSNRMRILVCRMDETLPKDDFEILMADRLRAWWQNEFEKLPGWNEV